MADSVSINSVTRKCNGNACRFWDKPNVVSLHLEAREVRRLDVPRDGAEILCVGGALWITQEPDPKDHVLHLGERFIAKGRTAIIAQGLRIPRSS